MAMVLQIPENHRPHPPHLSGMVGTVIITPKRGRKPVTLVCTNCLGGLTPDQIRRQGRRPGHHDGEFCSSKCSSEWFSRQPSPVRIAALKRAAHCRQEAYKQNVIRRIQAEFEAAIRATGGKFVIADGVAIVLRHRRRAYQSGWTLQYLRKRRAR